MALKLFAQTTWWLYLEKPSLFVKYLNPLFKGGFLLYSETMKDAKSDFFRNLILSTYLVECTLGLYQLTADGRVELDLPDYERLSIDFDIDGNLARNSNELVFRGIANSTVNGWIVYGSEGNPLYIGVFKQPFEIGATGDLTIVINSIEIEER